MGLFSSKPPMPFDFGRGRGANAIPVAQMDLEKRYDVYCSLIGEERIYRNVRFLGIRTFEQITEFSSGFVNGFLEIEAENGVQFMIPNFGIQMICEHGTAPTYQVIRTHNNR